MKDALKANIEWQKQYRSDQLLEAVSIMQSACTEVQKMIVGKDYPDKAAQALKTLSWAFVNASDRIGSAARAEIDIATLTESIKHEP